MIPAHSVSILVATYNRATILQETLSAMCLVDRAEVNVEWIIINNNCTDDTDAVVRSFEGQLPLRLIHEPAPGKNRALNRALKETDLHEIVVFADDDVSPPPSWLGEILAACERWPEYKIFGGRIVPRWPDGGKPEWIEKPWLLSIGFSWHDLGSVEQRYPEKVFPFGPNFWVRHEIFTGGRLYRENIGPLGKSRIMGSETSFLKELHEEGHGMVYCPTAFVEHRIKEHDCDPSVLVRRLTSYGRGRARIYGVNYHSLLSNHPSRWWLRQRMKLAIAYLRLWASTFYPNFGARMERRLQQYNQIGWIHESFTMAREKSNIDGFTSK